MLRNKFYLIIVFLSVIQIHSQDTIEYSRANNTNLYTIVAPDFSTKIVFTANGGNAKEIFINGSWNRLNSDIMINDRENIRPAFDFALGTYTTLLTNAQRPVYQITSSENEIIMSAFANVNNRRLELRRTITLLSNGKIIEAINISNPNSQEVSLNFEGLAFSFGSLFDIGRASTNKNNLSEYQYFDGKKIQKASIHGGSWFGGPQPTAFLQNAEWVTLADNFFMVLSHPNFSNTVVVYNGLGFGAESRVDLGIQVLATNIAPQQTLQYQMEYYLGPRLESMVTSINSQYKKLFAWPAIFNWMLKPIEKGTLWVMSTLVSKTGSAGWTLILIAILVKLLLLPLSIKSAISMKKMRVLQPKLNKLQEKFGHDPQQLQMKTMELYKTEKVNPLGGCLPLLLQIPVFFALFRVLSRSVELRGAGFLWISDLTMPDNFMMIGSFSLHLLPIIMTLLQLVSVFLQQGRVGSSQNEMQKQMQMQGYFMPVIFLFLFWSMPSGLVLYWTVQNIFSILEQEAINIDSRFAKKSI